MLGISLRAPTRVQRQYLIALVLGLLFHACLVQATENAKVCSEGDSEECWEDGVEGSEAEVDSGNPKSKKSNSKRKRRKLSLSSNLMHDLGLNDEQKLLVAMVFLGIILLPRFFGFDTMPKSRFGDVVHRQRGELWGGRAIWTHEDADT